ncbi:surfeit locus protein 6 [Latimeria chalumnae]|uniref:Surfeit 6 n=1 Tax=Latimeria chalumnae TaxID=7897 RepID=H3AZR4_LATCH|nr:PREDICTED: surfeit locus protein 6 [Latimeria chalumnae]XP_005990683.1 PREDICTED: surfeit locus protein 6 [Latimeria chalumnae]|eukprot:XP_005990682.1 PREDICTED: surfeit locus protein 6 [Latimeria chalumnae]
MASLADKDLYVQSLARKVCAQQNLEPRKRKFDSKKAGWEETSQPKKKRKKKRKHANKEAKEFTAKNVKDDSSTTSQSATKDQRNLNTSTGNKIESGSFNVVNILRQRLHEKIQEARGQVSKPGASSEELEKKRLKRKQERERKKRKRKEIRIKKEQEKKTATETSQTSESQERKESSKEEEMVVFNKVEVHDEVLNKPLKKKLKNQSIKGNITPLTGKNYKQLLSRLEARKNKIEELKSKDEKKAKELEAKMQWTNVLYKAEGIKIKDNEEMLKTALKQKEKRKAQRQKRWEKRTRTVLEKMQQRQDKRSKNIQKKKRSKVEGRKDKARKKGRVLPEDIKEGKV